MQHPTVLITGTGLYTPPEAISNEELVKSFNSYVNNYNQTHADAIANEEIPALAESSEAFIEKASGIKSRYVMNKSGVINPDRMRPSIAERPNEEQSIQCEISVGAAKQAISNAKLTANDIDAVIVACSNPQRAYPAVSIEVQDALGIDGFAYDMNVACSSATFGIQAAYNAIVSGSAKRVLMVNPEITSGHLEWRDRDCHFIFGDACTAVVVELADAVDREVSNTYEIVGTLLKTVYSNNIRNNFGYLNSADESGIGARDKLFMQNGRRVFKDVCPMVASMIVEHLESSNIPVTDLNRMWLHQANLNMNELIASRVLGRKAEAHEAPVILDEYANTSSAGSIIAFHKHSEDLNVGSTGVICSFGAGYSVGSIIVKKTS